MALRHLRMIHDFARSEKSCFRKVSLVAASVSFAYHIALGIFSNYVPLDQVGAGLIFWIYSWSACAVAYFGVIGVIAEKHLLIIAFSCCLFLDSAILTICRFVILQYLVYRFHKETCSDPSELLGRSAAPEGQPASPEVFAAAYRECKVVLSGAHIFFVLVLVGITVVELWLAKSVYRYGRALQQADEALKRINMVECKECLE